MEEELLLEEQDRSKLDGIVSRMESNGESEDDIKFVVDDFKSKYGKSGTPQSEPSKKKVGTEQTSSVSDSQSGNSGSNSVSVSQEIDIPSVDTDPVLQKLYEGYMKSSELTEGQMSDISEKLTDQKEGDRSIWETAKALTKGFLDTGVAIPIYNFDTEEELVQKMARKNRTEFLEDLPEQDKARLLELVQNEGQQLDEETGFIAVQNRALESKAKDLADRVSEYTTEDLQDLTKEQGQEILGIYNELKTIEAEYNDNMDIIESNNKDIGTFKQEIDLLKRNYNGLDNFIGRVINTSKRLVSGVMEASGTANEIVTFGLAPDRLKEDVTQQAQELRQEAESFNEKLRPAISINDVENEEDFGEWLTDQIATQLPIITTLVATGGTTGSALLGTSEAGSKSLEMKAEEASGAASYTPTEVFLASVGNGTLEFLGERVTGGILSKGKRTLQAASKGEIKKGVARRMRDIAVDTGNEALSEGFVQLGQNMIDRYYLDKKDVDIFDGVEDAIASGGMLGTMMSTAPTILGAGLSKLQSKDNNGKIRANVKKLKNIQEQLNDPDLDADLKKELEGLGKKVLNENKSIIKKDIKNVESKSSTDLKEVSKLNKKIDKEESKARKVVDNPDIDSNIREDLSQRMLDRLEKLKSEKDVIMDPKNKSGEDIAMAPSIQNKTLREMFPKDEVTGKSNLKEELIEMGVEQKILDAISDDVTLEYKDLTDMNRAGYYRYFKGRPDKAQSIGIHQAYKDTPFGKEALIHESVHAATIHTLKRVLDNRDNKDILSKDFTIDQIEAVETLDNIFNQYKEKVEGDLPRELYGLTDLNEFVSEFMVNRDFKRFLERNPPTVETVTEDSVQPNPLRDIWESILKLLGITPNSKGAKRLEDINNNIDKVLEAQKAVNDKIKKGEYKVTDPNSIAYTYTSPPAKSKLKNTIKKLWSGAPIITYLDEQIFERFVGKPLEDQMTKAVKQGLESKNKLVRNISEGYISWFNGVVRTDREISDKRRLTGKQSLAYQRGSKITKQLQELIGFNLESAQRVHKVMDPELYTNEDLMEFDGDTPVQLSYDRLNDSEKMLHDMLREINDATHKLNHDMGFIDDKTYEKYKGNYIGRGYEVYEDLANEAEKEIFIDNKILGKIYKQRQDVAQWHIDNKVTDPIYLTVNRMIRTERNVAVKNYADGIANSKMAKDEPQKGYTQLNGKSYGSLDGKYVPNYIAEDFKGYFFSNKFMQYMYDGTKSYDKLIARQFLKRFHTVYSPVVQLGNLMSNHAFAFASGINVAQLWANLPESNKDLKNKSGDYLVLLENGIIDSNVLTQDLALTDEAQKKLKLKSGKTLFDKVGDKVLSLDEKAKSLYANSDNIMKLAAYKSLVNAGYTQQKAIQRVYEGFQNYSTVGKIWDMSSKTPIFGNAYIKFQADLMRIVKNSVLKRPLTTATFLGMISYLTGLVSEATGEEEEERDIREERPYIPKIKLPFVKDIPLVMRVWDTEVNLARYVSPYYNYDVPNQHWLETVSNFTPLSIAVDDSSEMGQERYRFESPDVLLGPIWAAIMDNKDFRQKSITDPFATRYKESGLTTGEKMFNKANYIARSVVPLVAPFEDVYSSIQTGEDFYNRDRTVGDIAISKLLKVRTWDDKSLKKAVESSIKSIKYNERTINNKIKSINRNFVQNLKEYSKRVEDGKMTKEQFSNKVEKLKGDSEKRVHKQLEKLVKEQQKMNELVQRIHGLDLKD